MIHGATERHRRREMPRDTVGYREVPRETDSARGHDEIPRDTERYREKPIVGGATKRYREIPRETDSKTMHDEIPRDTE